MWPFPNWLLLGAAALAGALVAGSSSYFIGHAQGVSEGRTIERTAAIERSMDVIRQRGKTNEKINRLDASGLCRELGYRWVSDQCIE